MAPRKNTHIEGTDLI